MALEESRATAPYYEPLALDFNLYLVTDRHQTGEKPLLKAVELALKGGVRAVQLREKDLGTRDLLKLAYDMRELTLKYDARLFINDRVDIAIAVDADGVHLSQTSMPPYAVRRFAGRLIIGVSAHSLGEAVKAERFGADFITLGPIFETPSKAPYGKPLGIETLSEVVNTVHLPVFAIGGIKLQHIQEVMARGAAGIALISGILAAPEIKDATLKYLKLLK
ncbi:MAG: thiamine phosphate synthase [Thermoplasmata archaeon]